MVASGESSQLPVHYICILKEWFFRLHAFIFLCRTNPWVKYRGIQFVFNFERKLYWSKEIKAYFLKNLFFVIFPFQYNIISQPYQSFEPPSSSLWGNRHILLGAFLLDIQFRTTFTWRFFFRVLRTFGSVEPWIECGNWNPYGKYRAQPRQPFSDVTMLCAYQIEQTLLYTPWWIFALLKYSPILDNM